MVVADSLVSVFVYPICYFGVVTIDMASSTRQSNHMYVIIRLKMSENVNRCFGSLFRHCGETDDAFLIGGVVEPNETFMPSAIRHCRRLADFRLKPNHRLYLAKLISSLVIHELV